CSLPIYQQDQRQHQAIKIIYAEDLAALSEVFTLCCQWDVSGIKSVHNRISTGPAVRTCCCLPEKPACAPGYRTTDCRAARLPAGEGAPRNTGTSQFCRAWQDW